MSEITRTEIESMRAWVLDCQWGEEPDDLEALSERTIVRGVARHYDGGLSGWLADSSAAWTDADGSVPDVLAELRAVAEGRDVEPVAPPETAQRCAQCGTRDGATEYGGLPCCWACRVLAQSDDHARGRCDCGEDGEPVVGMPCVGAALAERAA